MNAKDLRIVVVTPIFPLGQQPYRGHSNYQITRALRSLTNVSVVCTLARYPKWLHPITFDYYRGGGVLPELDVPTHFVEYPALPGATRWVNGRICAHYVWPFVKKIQPDLILNFWVYPEGYAAVYVARKLNIPVIVGSIGSDLNRIADPISRWLTALTLQRADFVMTKSNALRDHAIRMGVPPSRVQTIRNGCDTSIFSPQDRDSARKEMGVAANAEHILYVGRFDLKKGTRELLAVTAALSQDRRNIRLTLVGDGPDREILEGSARNFGVSDIVRFEKPCTSHGIARWLASADLLCLPSYSEGCPNAVLEAISCGRPVVATRVGGVPEIVNERCAILVPPQDIEALKRALAQALVRKWDAHEIHRQYHRSWDVVAKEIFDMCSYMKEKRFQKRDTCIKTAREIHGSGPCDI